MIFDERCEWMRYVCGCMQSVNELGDDGSKALVPALSEMKMLQSLDLGSKWK